MDRLDRRTFVDAIQTAAKVGPDKNIHLARKPTATVNVLILIRIHVRPLLLKTDQSAPLAVNSTIQLRVKI